MAPPKKNVSGSTSASRLGRPGGPLSGEHPPVGYQSLDENGHLLVVNAAWLELLGYCQEEVIGQCFGKFLAPEAVVSFTKNFSLFKQRGEVRGVQFEMVRKDKARIRVEFDGTIDYDAQGRFLHTHCVMRDITQQHRARAALRRDAELTDSIHKVQSLFIKDGDSAAVFKRLLAILVKMTGSEFGFLGEVRQEAGGDLYMVILGMSDISWDQGSAQLYAQLKAQDFEFRNLNNLAGAPAKLEKLVISNQPSADARSGGLPPGHPPIHTYMGIPMYFGGELMGVAGVANAPDGYTKEMAEFLEPLTTTCASIIQAVRSHNRNARLTESLHETARLLEESQQIACVGSFSRDLMTGQLVWSDEAYRLFGYEPNEVRPTFELLRDHVHPSDRQAWLAGIQAVIEHKARYDSEFRIVRKDGEIRVLRARAKIQCDQQGRPIRIFGATQDVTKRKQAQEDLARSERYYRTLLQSIHDDIVVLDHEFRIADLNYHAAEKIGQDRDQLIGQLSFDVFQDVDTPCNQPGRQGDLLAVFATGCSARYHQRHERDDGTVVVVDVLLSPLKDAGGSVTHVIKSSRDVSDLFAAQAALQASESKYRELVETASDIVYALDVDGVITFASPAVMNILGYFPHELVGKTFLEVTAPEYHQAAQEQMQKIHTIGEVTDELVLLDQNGQSRFMEHSSTAIQQGGRVVGIRGIVRDITARKQAESALQESETLLNAAQEIAGVGSFMWDFRDDVLTWSQNMFQLAGLDADSFSGNLADVMRQIIHPDDQSRVATQVAQMIATKMTWPMEFRVIRPDGSERIWRSRSRFIRDEFGVPIKCLGVHHDVTEQRQAESLLKAEKERAQMYLDVASVILVALDADGKVALMNRRGCEILGYEKEEDIRGKDWFTHFLPEHRRYEVRQVFQQLLRGDVEPVEYTEHLVVRRDKTMLTIAWRNAVLRDSEGRIIGSLSSGEDVTTRRQAEQALREAEKMAATGRMAAHVAHEINNPLAGIKNSFRLIRDAVPADHPDHDMVGMIEREIDRIARVVRQMYTSYSQRAQLPVDVSVEEAARDVLAMLEPLCREYEVSVQLGPMSSESTVRVPEGSVQQLLYNLIANAIKASPVGGRVDILAGTVDKDYVRVSVCDQGPGIPSEVQSRLFEPFLIIGEECGMKEGLGLGLSIVKSLVDSAGGKVEFESRLGEGTCFHVDLPLRQTQERR